MAAHLRLPVVGHHLAVFGVVVARGEVELVESEVQPVAARRGLEHAEAFGHDFLADPVPGDDGDAPAALGRASCRERVCQYVWISVGAGSLKKKNKKNKSKSPS